MASKPTAAKNANGPKNANARITAAPAAVAVETEPIPKAKPMAEFRLTMPGGRIAVGRCELDVEDRPDADPLPDPDDEGEDDA